MDTDSAIALTGCPGIEDVELTINTKHSLPSNMFILRKDGQLETVTPTDMEKQLPTMEMMFNYSDVKSATLKNVPQNQKIKVKFSVDASFIKFMGGNSGFVGKLLTQAQAYFARPGLGFDIQLENPYNVNHYETQFWTAENSISIVRRNVGFMSSNQDADVYAFLTVDNFPQDGTFGVSSALGGICSLYKTEKVLITEFRLNLLFTARVFVHEIGHLLGMRHDFEHPPSDNCPQNGFMGSGGQSNSWIWSECSKNDFLVYYNSILSSQGKWCLNE